MAGRGRAETSNIFNKNARLAANLIRPETDERVECAIVELDTLAIGSDFAVGLHRGLEGNRYTIVNSITMERLFPNQFSLST